MQTKEMRAMQRSRLRHLFKSIYMAVPFKKRVFSGLKKLWVPPKKFPGISIFGMCLVYLSAKRTSILITTALMWRQAYSGMD